MKRQSVSPSRGKAGCLGGFLHHAFYLVVSVLTLGPLLWIAMLSFRSRREFAAQPFGLPSSLYLDNYIKAITDSPFVTFVVNSVLVSFTALIILLVVSTMAGYAIARIPFKGSKFLFVLLIMTDAVPIFVILIPLFILVQMLGLSDSLWSLIFSYVAMRIGLSVILMRGFFRSISSELEDAARIDGCNLMQRLRYVMLPIVRPGLFVTAIVNFIFLWNEYFLATILLPRQAMFTLPPGLAAVFMGRYSANWPVMAAGLTLSILPTLLTFMLAQDKIIVGWTTTSK